MISVVALQLRHLNEHRGRAALAALGIAAGSALIIAVASVFGSMTSGVERVARLAKGADLQVTSPAGASFPEDVAGRIAAVPGVRAAVPLVRTSVVLAGERVLLLGADDRARQLGLDVSPRCIRVHAGPLDAAPVALGAAIDHRVAGRRSLSLYNGTATVPVRAAATITCGSVRQLNDGWFAVAPLPVAEALAGRPGEVHAVLVAADTGTSRASLRQTVAAAAGSGLDVASPRQLVDQTRGEIRLFQQGVLLLAVLSFVIGGFLVFNTMAMAALERRRELATLRALGGRRRVLIGGMLGEAVVLGVAGSAIGAALGAVAARAALDAVPPVLIDAIGVRPTFVLSPIAVVAAIVTGTVATVVATAIPARSATSVPPVEAMRPEGMLESGDAPGVHWGRLGTGAGAFVVGTAVALHARGVLALACIVLITGGFILGTSGAMGPLASAAAAVAGLFGAAGRLAGAALQRSPRRVWATTLAVVVAVGQVVAFRALTANQSDTFGAQVESLARPDLWVQTSPLQQFPANVRLPPGWVGRLAAVPGVASVRPGQATYATVFGERVIVEGVDQDPSAPLVAVAPPAARRAIVDGRGVSVSRVFAQHHHLHAGGTMTLPTDQGPQRVTIAAIADVPLPVLAGGIGLSLGQLEAWFGQPGETWLELRLGRGANLAAVRRDVTAVMRGAGVPIWVSTGKEVLAASRRSIDSTESLFRAMQWVVVGATALAVFNTLLISVVERRRELGILRAVGTSRRTVRRMVGAEAIAIGAVGAILGVVFGSLEHAVGVVAVRGLTGFHVHYAFLIAPVVVGVASAAAVVAFGSALPAWRAARINVIEAIGYE